MTPWTLLAWVGSIAVSALLAILVIAIVVQAIRSLRKPAGAPDTQIISSTDNREPKR
jgi:hypothetical protein